MRTVRSSDRDRAGPLCVGREAARSLAVAAISPLVTEVMCRDYRISAGARVTQVRPAEAEPPAPRGRVAGLLAGGFVGARHRPPGARSPVHRSAPAASGSGQRTTTSLTSRLELLRRRHVAVPALQPAIDGLSRRRERALQRRAAVDGAADEGSLPARRRARQPVWLVDPPDVRPAGCDGRASGSGGRRPISLGVGFGGGARRRQHVVCGAHGAYGALEPLPAALGARSALHLAPARPCQAARVVGCCWRSRCS